MARWFLGEVLRLPLFQTDNKPGEDDEVDKGTVVVLTRSGMEWGGEGLSQFR